MSTMGPSKWLHYLPHSIGTFRLPHTPRALRVLQDLRELLLWQSQLFVYITSRLSGSKNPMVSIAKRKKSVGKKMCQKTFECRSIRCRFRPFSRLGHTQLEPGPSGYSWGWLRTNMILHCIFLGYLISWYHGSNPPAQWVPRWRFLGVTFLTSPSHSSKDMTLSLANCLSHSTTLWILRNHSGSLAPHFIGKKTTTEKKSPNTSRSSAPSP